MGCAEVSVYLGKKHTGWIGSITSNTNVIPKQVQMELKGFSSQEIRDAQLADEVVGAIYHFVETKVTPTREERCNASKPLKNLMNNLRKLSLHDGVLFRTWKENKQLVLPKVYNQIVLKEVARFNGAHWC